MTKWTPSGLKAKRQPNNNYTIYYEAEDHHETVAENVFPDAVSWLLTAPELYEALEDCLNWIDYMSLAGPATDTTKARIEAALAKARGEQS